MKRLLSVALIVAALALIGAATFAKKPPKPPPGGQANPAIAFSRMVASSHAIVVMDADGSNATEIHRGPRFGFHFFPSWSPAGKSIAFEEDFALYRIDIELVDGVPQGTNLRLLAAYQGQLADGTPYAGLNDAEWSPQGHEIAVVTIEPSALCVVPADGGPPELVYSVPQPESVWQAAWNGDGTRLAVIETSSEVPRIVRIIARDTGEVLATFTPERDGLRFPDWSRPNDCTDTSLLAFSAVSPVDNGTEWVYTLDLENGSLTPEIEGAGPGWSPDNSGLVFHSRGVRKLNLASRKVQRLSRKGWGSDWRRAGPCPLP